MQVPIQEHSACNAGASEADPEEACRKALSQIDEKRYEERLLEEGAMHILKYGIAFCKKRCLVEFGGAR